MRFRITRQKALTGSPSFVEALHGGQVDMVPRLGGSNINLQRISSVFVQAQSASYAFMYQTQPAVRSAVDYVASNAAQLGLRLYERVADDEREYAGDHPACESLRWPNEQTPGQQFVYNLFADFLVYDNAYALKFPGPGARRTLLGIPPSAVGILGQQRFAAEAYRIYRSDGTSFDVPVDAMIHWRGYDPDEPRAGFSKLETLRSELTADATARAAKTELDRAGLMPKGWIERPLESPQWSAEAMSRFMEDWANMMKAQNRRTPVLEEGMEFKQAGVSPEDAQILESRQFTQAQVAAAFGMEHCPPQDEEERRQFYADVLQPLCERLCAFLDLQVLRTEYSLDDYYFEFNLDEKKMSDDRLKAITSAAGAPVLLRNEGRAMLNLPAVPDGDELVTPLNVIVGGKPSPQIMPVQNPLKPSQEGDERKAMERLPQFHPSRKGDLNRQHRNVDLAQGAVQRHFNRLGRSLNGKRLLLEANGERLNGKAVDWDRWEREFADDLHRVAEQIVETEGTITAFKFAGVFDMRLVQNWLRATAEGASEGINAKIREELAELGVDGALAKAPQHVASAGAGFGAGVTTWAREEAARQSPHPEKRVKVWVPNTARHAEFGGDTVPLGALWPAGFAPGQAPGCGCTMSVQ